MQEIPAYEYSKAVGSRCQVAPNGPGCLGQVRFSRLNSAETPSPRPLGLTVAAVLAADGWARGRAEELCGREGAGRR